jgi:SAM-dependent methyltransferase
MQTSARWPKTRPVLSTEQQYIHDDFYRLWLEVLPKRYNAVEVFNHTYPINVASKNFRNFTRTLDIGAGLGAHIPYEDLSRQEYYALEIQPPLAEQIRQKYPEVQVIIGDCEKPLDFADGYFNRVMAIHVLEHLANLPGALAQIKRILAPQGIFQVLIPCEGGFAYMLARNLSARRLFEKRYGHSYDWFCHYEHINHPDEIIAELLQHFSIVNKSFFPLLVPNVNLNLVIGLTLVHQQE